jgi:hypothetical protein
LAGIPFAYGDFIAKTALFPVAPEPVALKEVGSQVDRDPDFARPFAASSARAAAPGRRAQLCTDPDHVDRDASVLKIKAHIGPSPGSRRLLGTAGPTARYGVPMTAYLRLVGRLGQMLQAAQKLLRVGRGESGRCQQKVLGPPASEPGKRSPSVSMTLIAIAPGIETLSSWTSPSKDA